MGNTIRISKEFYWEMGHRLTFHDGPCRNVHGHSYKMRIEAEGLPDSNGIVLDYYTLFSIINPLIEQLDHSFLCDKSDELMLKFLIENSFKYNVIENYSTAENICSYIFEQIADMLKPFKNLECITIRIFETEDTYAEKSFKLMN